MAPAASPEQFSGIRAAAEGQPLRVLVLGGGGMFGAYQAGVWLAMEPVWQPDLVVGASAGALNAYAIAAGVSGQQLANQWRELPRAGVVRVWQHGALQNYLRAMCQRPLQRRLAVAVMPAPFVQERLYWDQAVSAEVLLASCAVPLLLPPKKLEGRWCIDGAIRRPCPVWTVKQLRAAQPGRAVQALGVNVWPFARYETTGPVPLIQPGLPLGPLWYCLRHRSADVERWMEQGRRQGERFLADHPEFTEGTP